MVPIPDHRLKGRTWLPVSYTWLPEENNEVHTYPLVKMEDMIVHRENEAHAYP